MKSGEAPPAGTRVCSTCLFYHPERPKKLCSVFGCCVSRGNCAAYIEDKEKKEREVNENHYLR